ncbi:MAG: hypothetical protein WD672_01140 [Woeseia sp.]
MTINLDWLGPFPLQDFFTVNELKRKFAVPGVYIWIEDTPTGEHLSYVGKASGSPPLFIRQQQHYANMIGGLYTIPKCYRSADFDWVPDWSKSDVAETLLDSDRFHQVVDDAFAYASHCAIYLAVLESAGQTKLIERQLLYDLQPTGTRWGKSTLPGVPLSITHHNAIWATAPIVAQARVLNLAE